jgi:hypothetical protein
MLEARRFRSAGLPWRVFERSGMTLMVLKAAMGCLVKLTHYVAPPCEVGAAVLAEELWPCPLVENGDRGSSRT